MLLSFLGGLRMCWGWGLRKGKESSLPTAFSLWGHLRQQCHDHAASCSGHCSLWKEPPTQKSGVVGDIWTVCLWGGSQLSEPQFPHVSNEDCSTGLVHTAVGRLYTRVQPNSVILRGCINITWEQAGNSYSQ